MILTKVFRIIIVSTLVTFSTVSSNGQPGKMKKTVSPRKTGESVRFALRVEVLASVGSARILAHLARCAAAIRPRPAADIVRFVAAPRFFAPLRLAELK